MNRIFIIGYMASGKTTLGRALARRLGCEFVDLDFCIEQRHRMKVSEIFRLKGEEAFRRMESAMLREVGEFENVVIACGGGTPCFPGNMDYMNARGLTLCLHAPTQCLVRRILRAEGKRPLAEGQTPETLPDFIERHIAEREPFYSQARFSLDGSELENTREIDATVGRTLELLSLQPSK